MKYERSELGMLAANRKVIIQWARCCLYEADLKHNRIILRVDLAGKLFYSLEVRGMEGLKDLDVLLEYFQVRGQPPNIHGFYYYPLIVSVS